MSVNWVKAKHGEIPHGALLAGKYSLFSLIYHPHTLILQYSLLHVPNPKFIFSSLLEI
jgi:hypothetical protein